MDVERYFTGRYVLESERLLYRVIVKEDTDDYYAYAKDDEISRYLLWSPHPSRRYTARYLDSLQAAYREGRFFDFALIFKETGRMIGTCGLTRVDIPNRTAEIGYVLSREFWHQGLAQEAVRTILAFAFLEIGFHRVEARFMKGNIASLRVMEKNGMHLEGYLTDALFVKREYRTVGVAAIVKDEYLKRTPDSHSPCRAVLPSDFPENKRSRFGFFRFSL